MSRPGPMGILLSATSVGSVTDGLAARTAPSVPGPESESKPWPGLDDPGVASQDDSAEGSHMSHITTGASAGAIADDPPVPPV
jgi:hypothetical protein